MSWQDDLRQLDQALAEGRIPADDYRKHRDQLLAAAAGAGSQPQAAEPTIQPVQQPFQQPAPPRQEPQSNPFPAQQPQSNPFPAQQPPSNPFPAQQPQSNPFPAQQPPSNPFPAQQPPSNPFPAQQAAPPQQQSPSGPFAPPFRWESSSESTQLVNTVGPDNADATQVVTPPTTVQSSEAERTQVVRPVQQPQGGGFQAPPPWQQQQAPSQNQPQWGFDPEGPIAAPNPTWLAQGPEVFETDKGSRIGTGAKIFIAVVLVLGLGVGAYFIFTGNKETPTQPPVAGSTPAAPTTTTKPPKPKDALSITDLPGNVEDHENLKTFTDAEAVKFLTPDETKIYTDAGAGKARLGVTATDTGLHPSVFTTEVTSAATAATAVTKLGDQQLTYGLTKMDALPTGVLAAKFTKSGNTPSMIRAHYAHKNTVVRIQITGDDLTAVTELFNDIIAAQLKVLPANG